MPPTFIELAAPKFPLPFFRRSALNNILVKIYAKDIEPTQYETINTKK